MKICWMCSNEIKTEAFRTNMPTVGIVELDILCAVKHDEIMLGAAAVDRGATTCEMVR
jgi:hypothetical protein